MSLNLNETSDLHYRYKMPHIEAKIESRGNGIKTLVPNIQKVSQAIFRPASYTINYLGFKLGALCRIDEKHDRYTLMGAHDASRLQKLIYKFIGDYVLCPDCKNPETALQIDTEVYLNCMACGTKSKLNKTEKIVQYFIKNPPNEDYNPTTFNPGTDKNEEGSDEIEDLLKDADPNEIKNDEIALAKNLKDLADQTESLENKHAKFVDALKPHLNTLKSTSVDPNLLEIIKTLVSYSTTELSVRSSVSSIFPEYIFTHPQKSKEPLNFCLCLTHNWINFLNAFLIMHTPSQHKFLNGMENLICRKEASVNPDYDSLKKIFMFFYKKSLIEEDVFKEWHATFTNSGSKNKAYDPVKCAKFLTAIKPFMDWIQQETEEDSGSEDDNGSQESPKKNGEETEATANQNGNKQVEGVKASENPE